MVAVRLLAFNAMAMALVVNSPGDLTLNAIFRARVPKCTDKLAPAGLPAVVLVT